MFKEKFLFIIGILLFLNITIIKASVMAIDYGSQWYKVSLITPKIPLELVLNEESQRKTRSIISIIDEERKFSNDAVSKSTRYPKQTFDFLKLLVGKRFNDEEIKFYNSIFDIDIIEDKARNSILIKADNETYTVEELISYQFSKAKLIAENMSGQTINKAIITVPRFFNQYERLSMVNAAEIAGIRVLSVMNEDTAAAVNYAMTRNFENQPRYFVFYDMGASCTTITLVGIKSVHNPEEKSKKSPEIEIIDFNYDKTLGGLAFDKELQLLIVDKIKKSLNINDGIEDDSRIMAKILIKARKAKEILSVNSDTTIYFDSLINDKDITVKVTREEFEKASEKLAKRINTVVENFFKSIKIPKENIDSVILVGGSTRVPMVQNILKDNIGDNKLANYVNSDEAIVMGSIFHGASLSQEFKVRNLNINDIHSSSKISYEYKLSDGKVISGNLFNEKDPLIKETSISLKTSEDFDVSLYYNPNNSDEKRLIFRARISNIKEVIEANAIKEKKIPKVTLNIALTNSDIVFISNATVKAKIPINHRETLLEKILKLINKSHWYKNRNLEKYKSSDLPLNVPKNFDVIKRELPLNQMINKYGIYPLTGTVKKNAIDRKKKMDERDKERVEIEFQKNDLESLIYKGREILNEQESKNESETFLSEEEIKTYKDQINELFENLIENGQVSKISIDEIKNKISGVQKVVNLVKERHQSVIKRQEIVEHFKNFIKDTRTFYETMNNYANVKDGIEEKTTTDTNNNIIEEKENNELESETLNVDNNEIVKENKEEERINEKKFDTKSIKTEKEEDNNIERIISEKVKKLCNEAETWMNDVVEKQSLLKNWDTPAFNEKDFENKILEIYETVTNILNDYKEKQKVIDETKIVSDESTSTTDSNMNSKVSIEEDNKQQQYDKINEKNHNNNINNDTDNNTDNDDADTLVNEDGEINDDSIKNINQKEEMKITSKETSENNESDNNNKKIKNDEHDEL